MRFITKHDGVSYVVAHEGVYYTPANELAAGRMDEHIEYLKQRLDNATIEYDTTTDTMTWRLDEPLTPDFAAKFNEHIILTLGQHDLKGAKTWLNRTTHWAGVENWRLCWDGEAGGDNGVSAGAGIPLYYRLRDLELLKGEAHLSRVVEYMTFRDDCFDLSRSFTDMRAKIAADTEGKFTPWRHEWCVVLLIFKDLSDIPLVCRYGRFTKEELLGGNN